MIHKGYQCSHFDYSSHSSVILPRYLTVILTQEKTKENKISIEQSFNFGSITGQILKANISN